MEYEEAIDYIRCALSGGCHQVCNSKYRGDCTDDEVIEAVEIATKAIGKQIPKKPIKWADKILICPNCARSEYIKKIDMLDTYCGFCGQAIDWSDQ